MRVSDFHFDLPDELIAQHPPATRGSSRMLVLHRDPVAPPGQPPHLTDDLFANLPSYLQPGDLLVLNDSRVLPARLFATRAGLTTQHNSPSPTGQVEVLLTEQVNPQDPNENLWRALVKPARKVQPGETLLFHASSTELPSQTEQTPTELSFRPERAARSGETRNSSTIAPPVLTAEVIAAGQFGERTLRFAPISNFYECLDRIGHMPLPPYIHRDQAAAPDSPEDTSRYQTVYAQPSEAQPPGSAAAPTAGLHFTPEILATLTAHGIQIVYLTLHVGLGTFQPVRVSDLADIRLHAERYTLPPATADALNRALREGHRIVAVGTTTTRTLEHIAQKATKSGAPFMARSHRDMSGIEDASTPHEIHPHSGQTSIFLSPGRRFRIVSGLLTNFHLPESTLLMLAAAFAGAHIPQDPNHGRQTILAAYAHAIRERYRFYSYGDCMLLL